MKISLNRRYLAVLQDSLNSDNVLITFSQLIAKFKIFEDFCFFTQVKSFHKYIRQIQIGSNVEKKFTTNHIYSVRFYLKGIGYKFMRPRKFTSWIRIELGYSVSTYVYVPASIKLFHKRDRLVIISFVKTQLIYFAKRIFHLRPADVYKGKGVRLTTRLYTSFKPGKQR
jgi:hypothetical protein